MQFVSYMRDNRPSFGVVVDENVFDVTGEINGVTTLKEAINQDALVQLAESVRNKTPYKSISNISYLPVITNPNKILCVGINYEAHRIETKRPVSQHPTIFTRFSDSQVAHNEAIIMPHVSTKLDYEGELAVIIAKEGRYIDKTDALNYVAGYSCYNDATIRDWQKHTSQMTPGKNFPKTGGLGPTLVTPDEIGDISCCTIQTKLNGNVVQKSSLSDMIFSVADIISYISTFTYIYPGDIICTGTPGGVGVRRDPQVFMKPGDEVTVTIDKVGNLVNRVECE